MTRPNEPPKLPVPRYFPPPHLADPDGLLCVGGELVPELLLDAYRHGIFPWPFGEHEPLVWYSPDPRGVLQLDGFHLSRRLARRMRSGKFTVCCDRNFGAVVRACAHRPEAGGTWITNAMQQAFDELASLGIAHSVEVYQGDDLVGGVYGLSLGGAFAAESMFHRVTDASKVALAYLVTHLAERGYQLLDIQQWTSHTGSLGATETPRAEFLIRLADAVDLPVTFGTQLEGDPLARFYDGLR